MAAFRALIFRLGFSGLFSTGLTLDVVAIFGKAMFFLISVTGLTSLDFSNGTNGRDAGRDRGGRISVWGRL